MNDYGQGIHQSSSGIIKLNSIEDRSAELKQAYNRYAVNKAVFERKESSNSSKSKNELFSKRKNSIGSHLEIKNSLNRKQAKVCLLII